MQTRHLLLASALLSVEAPLAMPAVAATPPVRKAAADVPEQIVVSLNRTQRAAHTIGRRTMALQNTPQAATHLETRLLKQEHATALPQAVRLLPTVQLNISNPRNTTINIRGLGASGTAPTDGIDGGVAVYVDGVYRSRPATALSDIPGLDGVTVLRGPAGTAGGMTATGGAIELVTAAPDLTRTRGSAEAGVGNYGYNRWGFSASTPIVKDKVAVRIDSLGTGQTGWVRNLYGGGRLNGATSRAVRTQVLAVPTDTLSVRLIADYAHQRQNCCASGLYALATTRQNGTPIPNALPTLAARVGQTPPSPSDAPYVQNYDSLTDAAQEDMGLSAQVDWHPGAITLSSITAFRWWNWWPHNDGDLNAVDVVRNGNAKVNQEQFTQEVRASGHWGRILDYTAGGFFMWQESDVNSLTQYGSQTGTWLGFGTAASPVAGVSAGQANTLLNGYAVRSYAQPTTDEYAAFADGTWHLTDRLDAVTGVRYTYVQRSGSFRQAQQPVVTAAQAGVSQASAQSVWSLYGTNSAYGAHMDNGFVTGQAALRFRISRSWMAYLRYARGGKSGGLNLISFSPVALASGAVTPIVPKETNDAFEIGSKIQLLQNRLVLSAALYQTNNHDYQVTAVREYQGTLQSYLSTAPEVRIRGAEADAHFSPLPNLVLSASASYNDAQFIEYATTAPPEVASSGPYSLAHTQVPFVPRWSFSVAADYAHPLLRTRGGRIVEGYLGGSYSYNTRMNTSANNSAYAWVAGYGTLNLHFGVRDQRGRWDLSGFVNNATDERRATQIVQGTVTSGNGAWYAYVSQPLNFGAIARVSF